MTRLLRLHRPFLATAAATTFAIASSVSPIEGVLEPSSSPRQLRGAYVADSNGEERLLSSDAKMVNVSYPDPLSPSDFPLANPERGLYWQENYYASHPYPLDPTYLRAKSAGLGITLILRFVALDMDTYLKEDVLSPRILKDLSSDFQAMRDAGVKCVLRFAYTYGGNNIFHPVGAVTEPPKNRILKHIAQLAPTLKAGQDVILSMQGGFIGPWGEWHTSTHFDRDAMDKDGGRGDILAALLDAVPDRHVQVRRPEQKRAIYGMIQYPEPTVGYVADPGFEKGVDWAWQWLPKSPDGTKGGSGTSLRSAQASRTPGGMGMELRDGVIYQYVNFPNGIPEDHTVMISGWSKAIDVPYNLGKDYSIYADARCDDGSWIYGRTANFAGGNTDTWEYSEASFAVPEGLNITTVFLHAVYRGKTTGVAYFDDIDLKVYGPALSEGGQPVDKTTAYDGSHLSRTGHHDDCFLASDTDFYTYVSDDKKEYPYLSQDTTFTIMGGESCHLNPPRTNCETALMELTMFHYTFLHNNYHLDVLKAWKEGGCYEEIVGRLGYRLALTSASYPDASAPGGTLPFKINLKNEGFASPTNPRRVRLVLRNEVTGAECSAVHSTVDVRRWYAGMKHTMGGNAVLPLNMPGGKYSLYLDIGDASPALAGREEFRIKVANGGNLNEKGTGLVNLGHVVEVAAGKPSAPPLTEAGMGGKFDVTC